MKKQKYLSIIIFLTLLLSIFFIMLRLMPQGIGESHDSVAYLRGAKGIMNGEGYVHETFGNVEPNSHYPPGFPFAVVVVAKLTNVTVQEAAKILNALVFGFNAALFFLLFYLETQSLIFPFIAVFAFITSHDILFPHFWAWSEPLFLTGLLSIIISWRNFLSSNQKLWLFSAGILSGLSILVRYAGITLIPLGLFILILFKSDWKTKLKNIAIFLIPAILPYYLWGLRNKALGQDAIGRGFSVEWISKDKFWDSFKTATLWFFPSENKFYFFIVSIAILFVTYWSVRIYLKEKKWIPLLCMTYFWGTYLFLILSISFFDHGTPLDNRILVSHQVVLLVASFLIVYPFFIENKYITFGFPSILLLWFFNFYGKNAWFINKGLKDGHGLISWELRFRDDVQKITKLPESALIYAPEFQSVWVGRCADRKVYPLAYTEWLGKNDTVIYVSYFAELNYKPAFNFPVEKIDTLHSGRLFKVWRKVE